MVGQPATVELQLTDVVLFVWPGQSTFALSGVRVELPQEPGRRCWLEGFAEYGQGGLLLDLERVTCAYASAPPRLALPLAEPPVRIRFVATRADAERS